MLDTKPLILFFKYAIPSILSLLAISSASIVDGYFIGNYVGSIGLAAINISHPMLTILFGFALMFSVGSSVIVGKLMGENKKDEISNIFTKSIISISIIGIFLCLLIYFNLETFFNLFKVENILKEETLLYLPIILFFLPFLMTAIVLDYFVRVDENPTLSFLALFLSALTNIILDYLFIVKFDFGLSGAAYATGISYVIIIVILIPHFFSKKTSLKLIKPKGSWFNIINTLKNGFSEFINESSIGITVLVFNYIMLKNFGTQGVASYTIIGYLIMISILLSFAISDSMQPIFSKNYGARNFNRMKSFFKIASISILLIELLMTILILTIPEILINLFLKDSEQETRKITLEFITYAWPAFLFSGLNILITSYLTSIQKASLSAFIAILRSLVLPISAIFILSSIFGNIGIFMALSVSEFITFLIAIKIFMKNNPNLIHLRFINL
ncbi:MAG: MATE family efflux transporter [Arcobacter sp.]|jgi:putative MATE family efflux protein|uniref:Multidrug export protein MepA n=1 Tax=Arcobacter defluvii TaxID=873191 RepID=A0AAE7BDV0_9BACT|nr:MULTISPECIES: MATE family efflux transporter [Arcobacter]MDY3199541.1 MATE family efflux transporter [Arcobacter sp.]QKF77695.1 MATE family efflux protein [Arcobacter defluvii]RXI34333.1 MATE family efflux transporter [Arcobacter defluvii]BAK73496.1 multi antimicrobial extrusion protein [Arcobacter sp. L]